MLDVLIITKNEEVNLPSCLEALQGWTRKVFVVDSGSTDRTQEIAESMGAEFVHHDWPGYAAQKNWALDNLPLESDWVLIVDADEVITPALRNEIASVISRPVEEVSENGFHLNRLFYFLDSPIRHCGYFPSWNLRLFKRGRARYEDRSVHEHMVVDGESGYLTEPMMHDDRRGIEHSIAKHNDYGVTHFVCRRRGCSPVSSATCSRDGDGSNNASTTCFPFPGSSASSTCSSGRR